ncbi:hypothetical protein [Acinetobacter wanghuae]
MSDLPRIKIKSYYATVELATQCNKKSPARAGLFYFLFIFLPKGEK